MSKADELCLLTIAEASRRLKAKAISPVELARAFLKRTAALNGKLNAYLLVTEKEAMAAARTAEKEIAGGKWRGPLHGIPLAIKDIYETAGIRTTAHSRLLEKNVPAEDAETVRRLHAAGMVLLGKLATHEFATGGPAFDLPWPPARNPWDPARFTGGSSSGSGAAIAAGMCMGSLGSDTGGSIRLPATFCGIAGIKPTAGLVSRRGVIPLAPSLDCAGPMAWTVEDCAILLQAIAGHDARDSASVKVAVPDYAKALREPVKGMRIGVIRHFYEQDLPATAEMKQAMADSVRLLEGLGCKVEEARTASLQSFNATGRVIIASEAYALHEKDLVERPEIYSRSFRVRVMGGGLLRAADYIQAQRNRLALMHRFNALFERYDAVITAGTPGGAPRLGDQSLDEGFAKPIYTIPANISAGPALSVCNGFAATGMPLGLQIIGKPFDDARMLRLGHAFEQAIGLRGKRPPIQP